MSLSDLLTPEIERELDEALSKFGGVGSFMPIGEVHDVADAVRHELVSNLDGDPIAVVHCSAPGADDLVKRGIDRSLEVRAALGDELGSVVIQPLYAANFNGMTIAAFPYSLSYTDIKLLLPIQRMRLQPQVFEWLRNVTAATATEPSADELSSEYESPLQSMIENTAFSDPARRVAELALDRLHAGRWHPRVVVSHNDFWKHNILRRREGAGSGGRYEFVVIDWPTARIKGHPIYDLVRLARSYRVTKTATAHELADHCHTLGCQPLDAIGYLAASIGWLGQNLGNYSPEHYVRSSELCLLRLISDLQPFGVSVPVPPTISISA